MPIIADLISLQSKTVLWKAVIDENQHPVRGFKSMDDILAMLLQRVGKLEHQMATMLAERLAPADAIAPVPNGHEGDVEQDDEALADTIAEFIVRTHIVGSHRVKRVLTLIRATAKDAREPSRAECRHAVKVMRDDLSLKTFLRARVVYVTIAKHDHARLADMFGLITDDD